MDVKELINNKNFYIYYQTILSPEIELVGGVEALVRAYDRGNDIKPNALFNDAKEQNLVVALEEKLIEEAIKQFIPIYQIDHRMHLFINISTEFFDYAIETDYIYKMVCKYNLKAESVVLDVKICEGSTLEQLKTFSQFHKNKGFYISLDDIGTSYNNLDVILYVMPDMIKVNMITVRKLTNEEYRSNLLKVLTTFCENFGILTVSKGIQTEEDLKFAMSNNMKFMQGYYISYPIRLDEEQLNDIISEFNIKMDKVESVNKKNIETNRTLLNNAIRITNDIVKKITGIDKKSLDSNLKSLCSVYDCIENVWFLDEKGIQCMPNFVNNEDYSIRTSHLFKTYNEGSDFSEKEIFYQLMNTILSVWVTKPFKSILSNNICISTSAIIELEGKQLVLCININYQQLNIRFC